MMTFHFRRGLVVVIIYTDANLFLSPAQTLVNTVNTVGVMGKGIAKEFKYYYPQMFTRYKLLCQHKQFNVGQLMLSKSEPVLYRQKPTGKSRQRWVLNFPTKRHWRAKSKLEYIKAGLDKFVHEYTRRGIKSVSFPQLGVGNGGLQWSMVKQLMAYYLSDLDIPVYIHIYHPHTDHYNNDDKKAIENNLNIAHDEWRHGRYIQQVGLDKESTVNVDGIVLPTESTFRQVVKLEKIKRFSVIGQSKKAVWLQKNTHAYTDHLQAKQLSLHLKY